MKPVLAAGLLRILMRDVSCSVRQHKFGGGGKKVSAGVSCRFYVLAFYSAPDLGARMRAMPL
jgi:hypothetical protein